MVARDGTWLATASRDNTVRIWDTVTGLTRRILTGHTGAVGALVVAPEMEPGSLPPVLTAPCEFGTPSRA